MFQSLQDGIQGAVKTLRGKGKLSEGNMRDGLKLVEQALLEADVSFSVVRAFMDRVSEQALGQKVLLSLNPDEQLMHIVYREMVGILGPVDPSLHLKPGLTTIMLCGLQGSGKTTTCGKLTSLLLQNKKSVMLCAADLQRPAAMEQLRVLGEQLGVPVHVELDGKDPVKVCGNAKAAAKKSETDVLILDTAGRLAIDEALMKELVNIDRKAMPDQVYLVVDGMTGQDAVNTAEHFNQALELDGAIMTKLDGDARGGALLSVKHVTQVPVKFIGTGERLEALEPFHPDRMASRILGGGDMATMIETAQREFDQEAMKEAESRLKSGEFTLEDFRKQLAQIAKPGLMQRMLGMMPGMGEINKMMGEVDAEQDMKRLFGIIDSMTPAEKENPKLIDPSRRKRIAAGSGVEPNAVNDLVKQFDGMKSIMESMAGKGMKERMQMMQDLQSGKLMDPSGKLRREKKGTGKRLSASDRRNRKKLHSKLKRKKRKR
jgi:signal recognition particle subunit SRP54